MACLSAKGFLEKPGSNGVSKWKKERNMSSNSPGRGFALENRLGLSDLPLSCFI
jgi:hypothetical protein